MAIAADRARGSLQARIVARLERAPERPAIAFYGADGRHDWSSLERFASRAADFAARLAARGLERGDVCIVVLPSGEGAATALLALLLLGAVPLLVAPPALGGSLLDLPRILRETVRRTRARLVLGGASMAGLASAIGGGRLRARLAFDLDPVADTGSPAERIAPVLPEPSEIALLQLTSGTTGSPRVCVWDHGRVLAALDGMDAAMQLDGDDRCFNWTPLYHDMGLVNNFLLCVTRGVPLAMLEPAEFVKRPALWLRGLSDTASTLTWSPNFGLALAAARVRDAELDGVRLERVRAVWNAAERVHLRTLVAFRERFARFGLRASAAKTNFGCAENVGGATFSDVRGECVIEHVDADALSRRGLARPVPAGTPGALAVVGVGRPHPGLSLAIVSGSGRHLPDGRVGEIALRTPSRMLGYLGDVRATRRAIRGDLLFTGDLGYRRGDELFWVGRVKERITVRGKKLDPSDLERVLFDVAGLREGCFAAFGVDDERAGTERLVVVCEVREPSACEAEAIRSEIREQVFLRLGVTVSDVVLVRPRTLAKTSSGKRRHRHFRRLYLERALAPFLVDPPQ